MKIQINGFDIEVNTDESNMTIKVMDSTGKELSNNTYEQAIKSDDEIQNVDIPSTEETQSEVQETPGQETEPGVQEETPAQGEETPAQGTENVQDEEPVQTGESFIPDFETFKKLRKLGKL